MAEPCAWKGFRLPEDAVLHWRIGPWRLWMRRTAHELHAATDREPDEDDHLVAEPVTAPDEAEWRRWLVKGEPGRICLAPGMLDLPLVVRPEAPLRLLTDAEGWVFLRIPVCVRVALDDAGETVLFEEPSVVLSKTWFGDAASGELCYSLRTLARRSLEGEHVPPHRAICPVRIRNSSEEPLDFERLCVRTNYLKVYQGREHLWTNEMRVDFRGENVPSRIEPRSHAPHFEPDAKLLRDSRMPTDRGLLRRSFDTLKNLQSLTF